MEKKQQEDQQRVEGQWVEEQGGEEGRRTWADQVEEVEMVAENF